MNLPFNLEDKIFEIQYNVDKTASKIISYFPFSESERLVILSILNKKYFDGFHSIFTDTITEEKWSQTKKQIKQKFKNELFDIDKMS